MRENFENLLTVAANLSFEQEISGYVSGLNNEPHAETDLEPLQIKTLSEKILLLPPQKMFLMFSKYCFLLMPSEAEFFYQIKNAKGDLLYCRKLLSFIMNVKGGLISDNSMRQACNMALKEYLDKEFYATEQQIIFLHPKIRMSLKKLARRVTVAAIVAAMTFSTMMIANADFRERVVSWAVETFEKYSIFELKSDESPTIQGLQQYAPHYIPANFHLLNTIEQPSLIFYEYGDERDGVLNVLMSLSNTRIYMDTEGIDLEMLELSDGSAYYYEKEGNSYIMYERNGYYFEVYGTISKEEVIQIAEGITVQ
jgi:hypothetical protein